MDRHVHIVSFDVPWPANYGGVIDVFYKIKAMQKYGIKIHLHTYEYGRGEAVELENYCETVHYYKRDVSKSQLFKSLPYIVSSRNSEELILHLMKDNHPILLEGLHTCAILNDVRLHERRVVVRLHNIEHDYYDHLAIAETDLFKKYYYHNEAKKLRRFERVLKKAASLIAISKKDERYFSSKYKNVTFIPAFHPHTEVKSQSGHGDFVLYHGNLSVSENKNAIKFILESVFNDLDIPLVIAGLNPSPALRKIVDSMPHVQLIANPDDAEMFRLVNEAQLHILVTFQATGLKLKLLNTLYNGRFCLVNDKMLSGSTLDELCIVANDAAAMKQQVKKLFKKSFSNREIQRRRQKLDQLYHIGGNVERLIGILFG